MQLFGNTLRFDEEGYVIPGHGVDFWEGYVRCILILVIYHALANMYALLYAVASEQL